MSEGFADPNGVMGIPGSATSSVPATAQPPYQIPAQAYPPTGQPGQFPAPQGFNAFPAQPNAANEQLRAFWQTQMVEVQEVGNDPAEFKNHQLPLARIKKIMKSDEDVRMISAEAPVLFAKACEMFILELTLRSWIHAEENKRRTLQRNDIAAAITKTDIFDFLVDIVPREDIKAEGGEVRPQQQLPSIPGMFPYPPYPGLPQMPPVAPGPDGLIRPQLSMDPATQLMYQQQFMGLPGQQWPGPPIPGMPAVPAPPTPLDGSTQQ